MRGPGLATNLKEYASKNGRMGLSSKVNISRAKEMV